MSDAKTDHRDFAIGMAILGVLMFLMGKAAIDGTVTPVMNLAALVGLSGVVMLFIISLVPGVMFYPGGDARDE